MSKKTKYYVVWQGRKTGIFTDWKECEAQIKGFDDARYKSFESVEEAERAIQRDYWEFVTKKDAKPVLKEAPASVGKPIKNSIIVDAAWNTATGDMEYQGIYYQTGKRIFLQGPFQDGTNNIGEFLAIVHALAYLQKKRKRPAHLQRFQDRDQLGEKKACKYKTRTDTSQQTCF
jgi:ribonuclease HI